MYLKTTRYKQFDSIEIKESIFKEFNLPNHFHDTYCIGLLSQGIKQSTIEGNHSIIYSNCVSIINPYQLHSDQNFDLDECHYKMIYINIDALNFIAKIISDKNKCTITFTNDQIFDNIISQAVLNFFNQVYDESQLESKLFTLIKLLLQNKKVKDDGDKNVDKSAQLAILDSIEFARKNFTDKIDINKMAARYKLSKYQFIRYFKKFTGLTPASYMIVCRINFAKSLQLKGFPIGQAALEAGFYDHPQYCKFFKYFTGLSPLEYQKNCQNI